MCRLSVVLRSSSVFDRPVVRISISDTGVGSCLEEFQDLKCLSGLLLNGLWDGVISVATTSTSDEEILHYSMNVKEVDPARRLTNQPSKPKNGAKFSGTELSVSTFGTVGELLPEISCFLQKILILRIPKLAIELIVGDENFPGSQCQTVLSNDFIPSPSDSNIARLRSGLEDYALKHCNRVDKICNSCFPTQEHLKIGSGVACSRTANQYNAMVMEAVILMCQPAEQTSPSCFWTCAPKTEVLFFKDFTPCSTSQSLLSALSSIDWKSYGLILKSISEQDGCTYLEWENAPPDSHIDVAIHYYHKQITVPPAKDKSGLERNLTRKAVKLALDDLKEKNAGFFLSEHAVKIRSYAPDLAKSIAGLILCSNDSSFQGECAALLGLDCQGIDAKIFEDCIEDRLISVIELNDRQPQRCKDAEPYLFQDDCFQEAEFLEEEYDDGDEMFCSLDL